MRGRGRHRGLVRIACKLALLVSPPSLLLSDGAVLSLSSREEISFTSKFIDFFQQFQEIVVLLSCSVARPPADSGLEEASFL